MTEPEEYDSRFVRYSAKMESFLVRVSVLLGIALLVGQLLMQAYPLRYAFSETARLEGVPIHKGP